MRSRVFVIKPRPSVYARQVKNPQLEADAWEIRKRAEYRLGEMSAALDKAESHGGKIRLPRQWEVKSDGFEGCWYFYIRCQPV
jgi:hypothetical protein